VSADTVDKGELELIGSAQALKYSLRELAHLDEVLILVRGRTAVVQAGGNLGIFPKHLSSEFETVYTFEPDPVCFKALQANAPQPNIIKIQAALGEHHGLVGTCSIRRDGKTNNHEGITHVVPNGVIPTLRIDDLALRVCDLIYLDIEGGELQALRGAQETLRRCRPVVCCEINKNLAFVNVTEEQIVTFIQDRGYRFALQVGSDRAFTPVEWQ
jgi:FkbM family methyltransferase